MAALGWIGAGLIVTSMLQRDRARLHGLNLAAATVLMVFNGLLGIMSLTALNAALVVVNGRQLLALHRSAASSTEELVDRRELRQEPHRVLR